MTSAPPDSTPQSPERLQRLSPEARQLRAVLQNTGPESCPTHYNFHMHTQHSDGQMTPAQVMEQALEIGLQGMAITDHHSLKGYWEAQAWIENQRWRRSTAFTAPMLWAGIEVNAELLGLEVHILGYGFDPEDLAMRPYTQSRPPRGTAYSAAAVIRALQTARGLAILAHPARYRRSAAELMEAVVPLGIDGLETYYAYGNPDPWHPTDPQCEEVRQFAQRHNLLQSCGTDTHGLNLRKRI